MIWRTKLNKKINLPGFYLFCGFGFGFLPPNYQTLEKKGTARAEGWVQRRAGGAPVARRRFGGAEVRIEGRRGSVGDWRAADRTPGQWHRMAVRAAGVGGIQTMQYNSLPTEGKGSLPTFLNQSLFSPGIF